MAGTLSLSPTVGVFPCPNCRETINTSVGTCPFCHTSIDPAAAEEAARFTSKISSACNDASYLRIMLGVLTPFAATIFFPFLGLVGFVGSVFVKYLIVVLAIRWWIKYGRIRNADPDFRKARNTTIFVSCAAALILCFLHIRIGSFSL